MREYFKKYLSCFGLNYALVLLFLSFTSCASKAERFICPPLVNYHPMELHALSEELVTHPHLKMVPVFLTDYGNERAECRALQDTKHPPAQ